MQTEEEKISRIAEKVALRIVKIYGNGGGGTSSAIESWVSENFLSIEFFSNLFKAYGPAETEGDPDIEILPNDTQSTISNIKAMFGFWTEQYVSALGQNPDGGGGSVVLNACLSSINASALGVPTGVNTGLIFNGNTWVYREMNDINMSAVWQALGASTSEQINISHLTDALVNYATASDVGTLQGYFTNGQANSALEADTLATSRTIWGQSFDGSANITGNMTGVTNIDALLYFDTTNSRIGVIQQSPAYTLDVTGTLRLTGAATFGSTMTVTGLITANGGITIPSGQSLTIGDAVITWDATAQGIKITKGLYSETFISALGAGSTGSGGVDMTTVWNALAASTSEQINASHLTGALSTYATQSYVATYVTDNLALYNLSDVDVSGVTSGQYLKFNGQKWVPDTPSGGGNYLPLSGGTLTGDLTLYVSSGDSPSIIFQRGTLTTLDYDDWKMYVHDGLMYFQINQGSGWSNRLILSNTDIKWQSYTVYTSGNLTYGTLGLNNRDIVVDGTIYTFVSPYTGAISINTTRVTQTVVDNTYTDLRPIILGGSHNSGTPSFSTTTDGVVCRNSLYAQPSTGRIYTSGGMSSQGSLRLYGDQSCPMIEFQRGTWEDASLFDWRINANDGYFIMQVYSNVNGNSWKNALALKGDQTDLTYFGDTVYTSRNLTYGTLGLNNRDIVLDGESWTFVSPYTGAITINTKNVKQDVAGSDYTNYRNLIVGGKSNSSYPFTNASFTGEVYTVSKIYVQPSTGDIFLYTAGGGRSPAITFQCGSVTTADYDDWKIFNESGVLYFQINNGSWNNLIYFTNKGVSIGGLNTSYALYANGEVYAATGVFSAGYVTALSDIRKKDVREYMNMDYGIVADAPMIKFTWKDGRRDGKLQVGSIAQYWQKALPEAVSEMADGELSMSYGVIALLSSIATARKVVDHERRIKELESENAQLRKDLDGMKKSAFNHIGRSIPLR